MKNKKMCVALSALFLTAGALGIVGCGSGGTEDGYEKLSSKDLPATTSVISVKDYRDKVKGGIAGAMTGVAYGFPLEFIYKTWTPESQLPVWKENMIRNGYDQDDVYLAVTAIEALDDLGLDVTSRRLGLYMYNKDFEFWNGSNNDALARGYAPPFAGYPKQSTPHYTCAYSDGNSYQCGALFGGLLGLNMTGFANEICQKFGEICTYGDGIYSTQFIAAMYGEAFFTNDVQRIIDAGLAAIPADSWSALIIQDVLSNYGKGMSAEQNFTEIETKWIRNPEYNWTVWPNGDNVTPGTGILLDAKCCSAFTVLGLLYGEGDIEKSMKITVQCANDSDSTAAATAGILATVQGFEKLDGAYKNGLIADQKIKYSRSTVSSLTDTCEKLMKDVVKRTGGKVAYVDGALSFVIPESAKKAEIEEYKCSKNPAPMEVATYTQEEMDQMRLIADPGFERCSSESRSGVSSTYLANGWTSNLPKNVSIEFRAQTAYTGQNNAKIAARQDGAVELYNTATVKKNTNYVLSCMVKTSEAFSSEFSLAVWSPAGSLLRSGVCEVNGEWTKVTLAFNSGNNENVRIGMILNGGKAADFVRVDDFELRLK